MKKIAIRTASGLVYVLLIIVAIVCGSAAFACVFTALTAIGVIECHKLLTGGKYITRTALLDAVGGCLMFLSVFFLYNCESAVPPLLVYLPYLLVRMVVQLYSHETDGHRALAASAMTQIYVALPMTLLNVLCYDVATPQLLLAGLIFIWINDTGAYCVGSMIGRHKLFERLSPKKSWEGFFGGLVFAIIAGIIFSVYFGDYFDGLSLGLWTVYAVTVSVFSTWGDLAESLIKRNAGVKDSSHIMPGHGGILDRIDSLLLVAVATTIFFYLI
ncbi:MAG: phosphatidate cytidylyltransferase [Candidatus Limisoma sp.]